MRWICALILLTSLPAASAHAAREHVFGGSFGEPGSGQGQLGEPAGVAADESSGDVYVVDKGNDRVEFFTPAGVYIGEFDGSGANLPVEGQAAPTGRFSEPEAIAVDNDPSSPSFGDVYVADAGHEVIDKYSAAGAYIGQISEGSGGAHLGRAFGIAVDPAGLLWVYQQSNEVDDYSDAEVNEFISSRQVNAFSPEPGFAIDANDDLYIKEFFAGVSEFDSSGQLLVSEADPLFSEPTTGLAVDLSNGDLYVGNGDSEGSVVRFSASDSLVERFGAQQLVHAGGVAFDAASETVYVADSAAGTIDVFPPEPPGPPTAPARSVLKVTATSAIFRAKVNPHGVSTEYRFEYGRCPSLTTCAGSGYENSSASVSIGSEFGDQDVSFHPQDLSPDSAYHFRVVANNADGAVEGDEEAFMTQGLPQPMQLPDGRTWEMVSPPQKEGAQLGWISEGIVQGAADGNAFVDDASTPTEPNPAGSYYNVDVFFGRGADSWVSQTIAPKHGIPGQPPVGNGDEFHFFSDDLSKGILQPFGHFSALAPGVTESTPYLRANFLNSDAGELCSTECYEALVTPANVPTGTKFGEEPNGVCERVFCGPTVLGTDPDLTRVVLESRADLTATSTERHGGLYEWNDGRLQPISLLPEGEINEQGGQAALAPTLGWDNRIARHAISNDGSRVVWTGKLQEFALPHLYLWDANKSASIRIDVPNAGVAPPASEGDPRFMAASGDGSRIFFTDFQRLTQNSTANETNQEQDLYEYDLDAPAGERITDLTVDPHAGEAADVRMVTGVSEDGSYVYFTSTGALVAESARGRCGGNAPKAGEAGSCNLYVRHDGVTTLIAELSPEDFPQWNTDLSGLPARVSPDGRWLAFMSNRSLTGYDNNDAASGRPDEEVYLYDATTDKLVCASCDPTGARPVGVEYGSEGKLVRADRVFSPTTWVAANLPPWTRLALGEARYQSRYLSDSGRLFFDSRDALVSQDVNGTQDVYEYEPPGVGDCESTSPTFGERSGGCVAPLSSGTSNEESAFLDASESGGDVFFLTSAKLLAQDFDNADDIYDARECAPQSRCFASPPTPSPPCSSGDSCKPAPSAPPDIFGAPASATFVGSENLTSPAKPAVKPKRLSRAQKLARALKSCRRKHGRRRRLTCERRARKAFRATKPVRG